MQSTDDHDLMELVKQGRTDKLGLLFERYHKQLYNLYLWQTHDPALSEDLVQDVFYRMLKYRRSYRGDGKFKNWMFSIAHSARIDYYRKKRHPVTSVDEAAVIADEGPAPDEIAENSDRDRLLRLALAELTETQREMLLMNRFEQLKYTEIAEITGCPLGTVKSNLHSAMKALAVHYKRLTQEDTL